VAAAEAYMRGIERCMPEATMHALAAHWEFGEALPEDYDKIFTEFAIAGIDTDAVATQLLEEGIASFAKSWNDLLDCIASKSEALKAAVA
jgi:transaldolase